MAPQGLPAQVRKHDVRKAGRQLPRVLPGQRIMANVASLAATARARDELAHPKNQPHQARPPTSRGQWRGLGPLPMTPTPPRQGRNITINNQATSSIATNKPGREQSTTSPMASVPHVRVLHAFIGGTGSVDPEWFVTWSTRVPLGVFYL